MKEGKNIKEQKVKYLFADGSHQRSPGHTTSVNRSNTIMPDN